MPLKDDLEKEVAAIVKAAWDTRDGAVVPSDFLKHTELI
jgi:hypothetical protein